MEGDRVFEFDDWRNSMSYWKGDFQYKETIKSFLSNTQWKKLRDGVFENFFRLQGSHDDAVKLATIYFVESMLMGKRKNQNVSERVMKIVDDDELCSSFNWISLCYEKLLKSLKSCLKPKQNTSDNENENENEKEKEKDKEKDKCEFPRMLCYSDMKSPHYDTLCKKYFHNEKLYQLLEMVPFLSSEVDTEPASVHVPLSQDRSSMPSTQFDEVLLKEIVNRLSEKFKKDMEVECTRIHQKIALSEKRIQNGINALKKNLKD
nr:uncharacterized protein LOC104117388 [Nicotiana tomentosiformis]